MEAGALSEPVRRRVAADLEAELPGLRLYTQDVAAGSGPTAETLRRQLRVLSNRMSGAQAMELRRQPIPHAYRVFFRHVGIDPEVRRTPIEQAVLERLFHGGFPSTGCVGDALRIALVETGVPVWAFDEAALDGDLQLRLARAQDEGVPSGRLAIADGVRALAELFGPAVPGVEPAAPGRALRLAVVAVKGVPDIHVGEALHLAHSALRGP